jgi:hypothetical protein
MVDRPNRMMTPAAGIVQTPTDTATYDETLSPGLTRSEETTMSSATQGDAAARRRSRFEVIATFLLAFAAVATAWSGYQAARWNGEASKTSGRVNALRIEAARSQGLAEGQTQVDIASFFEWADAELTGDPERAAFYEDRFRPEFRPAFDSWLATAPAGDDERPPGTPFTLDDYRLAAAEDATELDAEADATAAIVRTNLQRSTNYVLAVVLFSVALFFAGISTKMTAAGPRSVLLACGSAVFLGTLGWILTSPISISV